MPGYVLSLVSGRAIANVQETIDVRYILRIFALSVFVHALVFPWWTRRLLNYYIEDALPSHTIQSWIWAILTLLVLPIAIGVFGSWLAQRSQVDSVLDRFGLGWFDRLPTAWDYSAHLGPSWVRIYLEDGSVVGGRSANGSYYSLNPRSRDIYIEQVYTLDELGNLDQPVRDSLGVWIPQSQITRIEFLSQPQTQEANDGNSQETDEAVRQQST